MPGAKVTDWPALVCNPAPNEISPNEDRSGCTFDRDFEIYIHALHDAEFITSNSDDDGGLAANPMRELLLYSPDGSGEPKTVGACVIWNDSMVQCAPTAQSGNTALPSTVAAGSTLQVRNLVGRADGKSCTESFSMDWLNGDGEPVRPLVVTQSAAPTGAERPVITRSTTSGVTPTTVGNGMNDWSGVNDYYDIVTTGLC